jgi:hypothetical protein
MPDTKPSIENKKDKQAIKPNWFERLLKWDEEWSKKHPKAIWIGIIVLSIALSATFFLFSVPFGFFIILSTDAVKSLIEAEATILGFFGLIAVYLMTSFDSRIDKLEERITDSALSLAPTIRENLESYQKKVKERKRRSSIAIIWALFSLIISLFLSIVSLGILGTNNGNPTATALIIAIPVTIIASTLLFIGAFSIFVMIYRIGKEPE